MQTEHFKIGIAVLAFDRRAADQQFDRLHLAFSVHAGCCIMFLELDADLFRSDDFDLNEMQEGEIRSVVDDAGRSVLITREADGMKIEVDGKTIHMPLFGGGFEHHAGAMAGNFDLQMFAHEGLAPAGGADDITIISGKPLDGSTQESIKSVLLSAGHDGDVRFVDKSVSFGGALGNPHGDHHIKFVRKEVAVTQ